jgi:hypothetical protein
MRIALNFIFIILLFSNSIKSYAQEDDKTRQELKTVIDNFFDAMHKGDSAAMSKTLHPTVVIKTAADKVQNTPVGTFLMAIAMKPRANVWLEKLYSYEIKWDANLAWVSTEFSFFLDGNLSHCGYNHFVLAKEKNEWKIQFLMDSRRTTACLTDTERKEIENIAIDSLLNRWHKAAATADEAVFFDSIMTSDAIYLGTDVTERWLRDELKSWAKSAFEKEVAWAFTPKRRAVYFNENDPRFAWFEEDLDTWMGPCRGSGVLLKTDGKWKLKHYNLAISVPNDAVDKYLNIIGIKKKK